MLGAARTAWFSTAWNTGDIKITAEFNTTAELNDIHVMRPLKFAGWTGVVVGAIRQALGVDSGPGPGEQINSNDIGSDGRNTVAAYTVRFGNSFLADLGNNFVSGLEFVPIFEFDGGRDDRNLNMNYNSGNWGFFGQADSAVLTDSQFNAARNQWLGVIIATSFGSSAFGSWTGGSDPTGHNWAQRVTIVNLETRQIMSQADGWAFRPGTGVNPAGGYYFGGGGGPNQFKFLINNGDGAYNGGDWNLAAVWYAVGSVLDPAVHWPSICGTGAASTVEGVRAWMNFRFDSADAPVPIVNNNSQTTGHRLTVGNPGDRAPSAARINLESNNSNNPATPPSIVDF